MPRPSTRSSASSSAPLASHEGLARATWSGHHPARLQGRFTGPCADRSCARRSFASTWPTALAQASEDATVADRMGGRVHVRWDDKARAKPHGQIVFFVEVLATAGVFDRWAQGCPLRCSSPNAARPCDMLDPPMLGILATLVQAYEARHFPIGAPDPVEAIKFRMEQGGLTVKDLESIIGRSNRVYEVLNHKRPLTLAMIRRLHRSLGIPAEVLIAETASG
jgi:HTH-type transcriptional regulator/antitoxin HigA